MTKICNKCGKTVDDDANVCPYCRGLTFRKANEITVPNNDLVHRIFYWPYSQGNVLSKTKLLSIAVFLFLILFWIETGLTGVAVGLAVIFAAITYLLGYLVHRFRGTPKAARITHNDYGLGTDIVHLLFYWQNRNGAFILSKTKCLSFAVFIGMFIVGLFSFKNSIIFSAILFGLLFEIPVFLVGYIIHKVKSISPVPQKEIPPKPKKQIAEEPQIEEEIPDVIPEYVSYAKELEELDFKFRLKDKNARELIEKRFEPPQITYTRFITGVDKSKKLFEKNMDSAMTMIKLADTYSPRIAGEVESKISILRSIITKLDDLSNELILNEDLAQSGEVDNLIDDMDNLINSVKDYDEKNM